MRFEFITEGATERQSIGTFLKRWIDPQLAKPVGIHVTNEAGFGNVLRKVAAKAKTKLAAPGNDQIIGVYGLIDLHGPEFPTHLSSVRQRFAWFKQELEAEVNDRRFRMHFAVHEVEAWLLSD